MLSKSTDKESRWTWVKNFVKTNLSLIVIVVAALLLELTSGVMYYAAQDSIRQTMEKLVERDMNSIYLTISNKLAGVEVIIDNYAWVVSRDLENSEWMFDSTQKLLENNSAIMGCNITFTPYYYPERGRWFEPVAIRKADGSIESKQVSSFRHDYTKAEFYTIPMTTGRSHWCEPYMDKDGSKTEVTTYSTPVRDSRGKIVCVAAADISLDWLDALVEEDKMYKYIKRFIVSGRGSLLAGEDSPLYRMTLEQVNADKKKDGYAVFKNKDGVKYHVFYQSMGGSTNWLLISVLNDREVFGKLYKIRADLMIPVFLGFLFIGFIVWRSSRNLERLRKVNAEKERISSELRVASRIQQSILPPGRLTQDGVDVFGSLVPAREVGGDLFDYFIRDEKLFFCIGDVSGKGMPSAILMAGTRSFFRAFSTHESNPAHIMHYVNGTACQGNSTNMFATLFIGVLDLPSGHLHYCNAGHDAPIVISGTGLHTLECNPHLPVGLFDDVKFSAQETVLSAGSTIFLYTDGLTEAKNSVRKQFGLQRVHEVLGRSSEGEQSPKDMVESMTCEVRRFVNDAEQSDDLTLLAIRYEPRQFESIMSETFTLKNDIHEVPKLNSFQKALFEKMGIEKPLANQIRLAVEEAVVNAIDYAYPAGTEGDIAVCMMTDGYSLKVVITDSGVPFDPTLKEDIDISLPAEERQVGGLGIHLFREIMDSVNYEHLNGRNTLTLMKRIHEH